jgi:hypothetical protein
MLTALFLKSTGKFKPLIILFILSALLLVGGFLILIK